MKTWAHHAARLGEREASRLFMIESAAGEPRTDSTLSTVQFHLAHLGYVAEAVAVRKDIAICNKSPGSSHMASKLLGLVRLEQQAGHFTEARQSLQAAGQSLSALQDWPWMGMWQSFVKEHFLLVLVAPDGHTGRLLLNEADQYLRGAPQKWLSGVLDSAIAAAEHLNDENALGRYQVLNALAQHQHEQSRPPGSAGTA
ncbi:hypothetical protein T261_0059 [Streptomyces lydicus]|nr:hypothetical protein T261_0059 [Streptomyces lydicus]